MKMYPISHFTFKDRLFPTYVFPDDDRNCEFCKGEIHGYALYYTTSVDIRIHEQCGELPEEIKHPFHPHPLILTTDIWSFDDPTCDLCKRVCSFFGYACPNCQYCLDATCASLSPFEEKQDLSDSDSCIPCQRPDYFEYFCKWCGRVIEGTVCVDLKSKCLLHESCTNLPEEINHPFHSSHPLKLVRQDAFVDGNQKMLVGEFTCHACGHQSGGHCYFCSKCDFYLDVHCAFLEPNTGQSFEPGLVTSHQHSLIPCEKSRSSVTILCSACVQPCKDTVYVCTMCHVVLDESCSKLPLKIQHPFDCRHELVLYQTSKTSFKCTPCGKSSKGFRYACLNCLLVIDTKCAWPISPIINSEIHHHSLVFLEKPNENFHCHQCDKPCVTPFFCCLVCEYYLHLHCHPELPRVLKHETHLHSLSFTHTPIKDFAIEDEDSELYCNICEGRRKLTDPTYYCADCHFVAHVHCLTSQILSHFENLSKKSSSKMGKIEDGCTILGEDTKDPIANGQVVLDEMVSKIVSLYKERKEQNNKLYSLIDQRYGKEVRARNIARIIGQQLDI